MSAEYVATIWFNIAVVLYVIGWFGGMWWAVNEADDLIDAITLGIGVTFFGIVAALVWPLSLIFGFMYWLSR